LIEWWVLEPTALSMKLVVVVSGPKAGQEALKVGAWALR
jgi:hypothetical protein